MEITVNDLKINYIVRGEGKPLLLLHGWGACIDIFAPVTNELCKSRKVYVIDFPGFGGSDTPKKPMTVSDYTEIVARLIRAWDIAGTDVICHSFGGRVTIVLAAKYPELVGKLVFVDAAGLKKKRSFAWYCRVYTYKLMKKAAKNGFLYRCFKLFGVDARERTKNAGSADYRALTSDAMRGTFVNVVNQDLKEYLKDIRSSSLMIYGENDTDTPVYFGQTMEKLIPDGGLVVLKNAGHFSYLDQFGQFIKIVKVFLEVPAC